MIQKIFIQKVGRQYNETRFKGLHLYHSNKIESTDRLRNVITVLCYLVSNFDTNIIVKEVDTESRFDIDALPQIKEYCEDVSCIKYIFEKSEDPIFLKEKILNEMLVLTDTKVVVNYDCDVLFPLESYEESYQKIINNQSDMIYPYGEGPWQYKIFADDQMVTDFLNNDCNFDILRNDLIMIMLDLDGFSF